MVKSHTIIKIGFSATNFTFETVLYIVIEEK